MKQIGRLLTAMITPFNSDSSVNYDQVKNLAVSLVNSGSDGLVVAGTTGEAPVLRHDEKLKLFETVKSVVGDRASIVAGTGNYGTQESIDLSIEAADLGVDAVMAVVPYYNKPPQEGLFQHFKAIAENSPVPVILYNVPSRTITNLSAETTLRLSKVKNILGIKEASGDFDQIAQIIQGIKNESLRRDMGPFHVWSGNDSDTFGLLCLGGYGIVSVASHLVGKQIASMISMVVENKNLSEASAEHHRLMPIFKGLFVMSNPIPVKYCVNLVGLKVGKPRLPLVEPDESTIAFLENLLTGYQIDISS